eukprot:13532196-Ditylum_brightwellii.AAC.1
MNAGIEVEHGSHHTFLMWYGSCEQKMDKGKRSDSSWQIRQLISSPFFFVPNVSANAASYPSNVSISKKENESHVDLEYGDREILVTCNLPWMKDSL